MPTCYAITHREHEDYKVFAVFTSKKVAERELPRYTDRNYIPEIEEFPLDPVVLPAPAGMKGFYCIADQKEYKKSVNAFEESDFSMRAGAAGVVIGKVNKSSLMYRVRVWAKDKDHAIKAAVELIANRQALDTGGVVTQEG